MDNPKSLEPPSTATSNANTMPKSLEKTRKKIAKKKGNISALHENSRDSQRLRRAQMRDDKLVKVASSRRKNDQPLSEWWHAQVVFKKLMISSRKSSIFSRGYTKQRRKAAGDGQNPDADSNVCVPKSEANWTHFDLLSRFVHQYDEEFNILKKERRAGRPASTREDLLRMKIAADEKEHENGFCESRR
jgi:translation machinery-associated protein 16